jgi:hypothetical protein
VVNSWQITQRYSPLITRKLTREVSMCDEWWILVGDLPWVYHMWWVVNIGGCSAMSLPHVMSGEYWWVICHEFTTCDEWWTLVSDLSWVYHVWWVLNIVGDLPSVYVWWVVNIVGWSAMSVPHVMSGEYWWVICHEFSTYDEWWILVSDLSWVYLTTHHTW